MYEILAAGATARAVTAADLNIPDPPAGADPQMAAGFDGVPAAPTSARNDNAAAPTAASGFITIGLTPLTSLQAGTSTQSSVGNGQSTVVGGWVSPRAEVESPLVIQGADRGNERASRPWIRPEVFAVFLLLDGTQWSRDPAVGSSAGSDRTVRASGDQRQVEPFDWSGVVSSHPAVDSVLEELALEWKAQNLARGMSTWGGNLGDWTALREVDALAPSAEQPEQYDKGLRPVVDLPGDTTKAPLPGSRHEVWSSSAQPSHLLLKTGLVGIGASVFTARILRSGRIDDNRRLFRTRRELSR
jgi:hypothetical protein